MQAKTNTGLQTPRLDPERDRQLHINRPLHPPFFQVHDALLLPGRDWLGIGHLHGAVVHGLGRLAALQLGPPRPRWLEQRSIQVRCTILVHLEVYPLGAIMRGIQPWELAIPAALGTPLIDVAVRPRVGTPRQP